MIREIESCGLFCNDLEMPGGRRRDGVAPYHPNGIQLSKDRFLILISTIGFRGIDDTRGIHYQIREGDYAGPLIKEGTFASSCDDWQPLHDGRNFVRQFGHPVAFGVPKGALIKGRRVPHENLFAVKFRQCARILHPDGYLTWRGKRRDHPGLMEATQRVQWLQFRLNEAEDDIDILQPMQPLRQVGYEEGTLFCPDDRCRLMNQSFVQPISFNEASDQWVDVCHFNSTSVPDFGMPLLAALKYSFNSATALYEWVETGPAIAAGLFEGNISRWNEDWIIAGRPIHGGSIGWVRVHDPFTEPPTVIFPPAPTTNAPLSVYTCPDGILRLFTGNIQISPYCKGRNPLYCWEINPDRNFAAGPATTVIDSFEAGINIPLQDYPMLDMAKLLPHTGGASQTLLYRARSHCLFNNDPSAASTVYPLTPEVFAASGMYRAKVHYKETYPAVWQFA